MRHRRMQLSRLVRKEEGRSYFSWDRLFPFLFSRILVPVIKTDADWASSVPIVLKAVIVALDD